MEDINFLKTSKDKVRVSQGCIEINTKTTREDLFRKYIVRKYAGVNISSTSDMAITTQCQVVLIKKTKRDAEKIKAGNRGQKVSAQELDQIRNAETVSQFSVMGGTETKVRVENDRFKMKCTPTGKGYNIVFNSDSPLISLSTTLFVNSNQIMKLGTITADSENQDKNIALINNQYEQQKSKRQYDLYIKVFE